MPLPSMPKLAPATFRWHESPSDPRVVQRLANGTEAWVGIKDQNAKGQYDNYLNTTLRIGNVSSLCLTGLKEKLAAALIHVRFQHPEVGCTAVWGETGPPYIQYMPPSNTLEALMWARHTIETRLTTHTGLMLRAELEKQRSDTVRNPAKSLVIFLIADVPTEETPLKSGTVVDMLMHFNHIYWDGISARACVGDLLRRLGQEWGHGEQRCPDYKWGDEVLNLSEPILDACKVDIAALGDEFDKAREQFIASLIESGSSWGLSVKNVVGSPCTEWYNFSNAESHAMIRAVKTRLGSQYTISHLGHAATVLALLKANPLPAGTPDSRALITPLPVDGRRFLRDEYIEKQFGSCQAGAIVEFENLNSWVVDESDIEAVKWALKRGCKHVKDSYDYWLGKDFQLALGVSKDNFLSAFLSSTPTPFTGSSIPVFISDGVVDRYVPGEVVSASGEKLVTVDNCVFFLDTYLPRFDRSVVSH